MRAFSKMNRNLKRVWLERLRSGRYPQAMGALRQRLCIGKNNQERVCYCPLGLLAHAINPRGWAPPRPCDNAHSWRERPGDPARDTSLPGSVLRRARISEEAQDYVIHLSDGLGWSFKQIADWIEEGL